MNSTQTAKPRGGRMPRADREDDARHSLANLHPGLLSEIVVLFAASAVRRKLIPRLATRLALRGDI